MGDPLEGEPEKPVMLKLRRFFVLVALLAFTSLILYCLWG